jgi:hypothetical protein
MRLLFALLSAAGLASLAGCYAYGGGVATGADVYYGQSYGSYGYYSPGYTYHDRGYYRDRDRDGVPNRYDRDRDGDGVPNRLDRAPSNPRRY